MPILKVSSLTSNGISSTGAFIFAQAVLREMEKKSKGTLIFTGATASIKGSAKFAAFAPAKYVNTALSWVKFAEAPLSDSQLVLSLSRLHVNLVPKAYTSHMS